MPSIFSVFIGGFCSYATFISKFIACFAIYLALCANCGLNENLAPFSFPVDLVFTIINSSAEGTKHLNDKVPAVVVNSPLISAFHKSVRNCIFKILPTGVNNN